MRNIVLLLLALLASSNAVYAHCQIPCGIYGDKRVFEQLEEDIKTIEKAMKMIEVLSKEPGKNANQLVRWVNNKETHANKVMDTVLNYFLAQRVKFPKSQDPEAVAAYQQKLALLHQMIVYSMKAKQTIDLKYVVELRSSLSQFYEIYFSEKQKKHIKKHH